MLVLRRKAGEAIVIDGTITFHVLAVEGERIKIGVTAPPETPIVRGELLTPKVEPPPPSPAPTLGRSAPRRSPGLRPHRQGARL